MSDKRDPKKFGEKGAATAQSKTEKKPVRETGKETGKQHEKVVKETGKETGKQPEKAAKEPGKVTGKQPEKPVKEPGKETEAQADQPVKEKGKEAENQPDKEPQMLSILDITSEIKKVVSNLVPKVVSDTLIQMTPELAKSVSQAVTQSLSQAVQESMTPAVSQSVTQATSQSVSKAVSQSVPQVMSQSTSDLKTMIGRLFDERLQNMDAKLKELKGDLQVVNVSNQKRFSTVEETLGKLDKHLNVMERSIKDEGDATIIKIERKCEQLYWKKQQEQTVTEKQWSEQLAKKEAVHQDELQTIQKQHHQDMLSVLNDYCQKLRSSFDRKDKPYEVNEIRTIIDDVENSMVQEIEFQLQRAATTAEDLGSFEEALARSQQTSQLHGGAAEGGNRDVLGGGGVKSAEDIAAALNTFESEAFDPWSSELKPPERSAEDEGLGDDAGGAEYPVVEEVISKDRATITGDRGNTYYVEELKRTIDDIIALDDQTNPKKKKVPTATLR